MIQVSVLSVKIITIQSKFSSIKIKKLIRYILILLKFYLI